MWDRQSKGINGKGRKSIEKKHPRQYEERKYDINMEEVYEPSKKEICREGIVNKKIEAIQQNQIQFNEIQQGIYSHQIKQKQYMQ